MVVFVRPSTSLCTELTPAYRYAFGLKVLFDQSCKSTPLTLPWRFSHRVAMNQYQTWYAISGLNLRRGEGGGGDVCEYIATEE